MACPWTKSRTCCRSQRRIDKQDAFSLLNPYLPQAGPSTPLHAGHVGLLACSGLLNGIFGVMTSRHIAFWQAIKVIDKTEEEEDGVITVREKERFSNELTLVYSTGEVAILK